MMDDEQLLHAYARERSESAFGELVTRHIDFVYSTALRVVSRKPISRSAGGALSSEVVRMDLQAVGVMSERFGK